MPLLPGLTEEVSLRDRSYIFPDRAAAGRRLAETLADMIPGEAVVFAIPAGGLPVAAPIARALNLPLDLIIVRKIQIPWNTEAGFGALTPDGEVLLNEALVQALELDQEQVASQIALTRQNLEKREALFRGGRPYPDLTGKVALVVDDGLASGYTMLAALKFIKKLNPEATMAAVPTGLLETIQRVLQEATAVVCLNVRRKRPFAVAAAYRNWYDVPDNEVQRLLREFTR
ncbi:MAG: phosphoribosyltransferase [Deltaproteobacteria bacterium]|nr:phosphoribosyltransferase [Deltaproteobacteria bacterium]